MTLAPEPSHKGARALWVLLPFALGHAASIALVAAAVVCGFSLNRSAVLVLAAGLAAIMVLARWSSPKCRHALAPMGHAGLALCSFMASTAHGAGLMLVPALMPLCTGVAAARGPATSALLLEALSDIAIHSAGMLVAACLLVTVVPRGVELARRRFRSR